jgi:hypothetical protein
MICAAIFLFSIFIIKSCSSPTCGNSISEYQNGYVMGKTVRSLGESYSCNSFVKLYNEQDGHNPIKTTDCFCEGYMDGLHGQSKKY